MLLVLFVSMGYSQTRTMRSRTDTLVTGAAGGVTDWKPCYMRGVGRSYTFSAIQTAGATADTRFAFTYRDTVATMTVGNMNGGGAIPYISGQTITVTVPNVDQAADTVWVKGNVSTVIFMWKF